MSEELLHEETQNEGTPVTMADLEEHFDDANPWNVVKSYMEKGTVLPVKVEGIAEDELATVLGNGLINLSTGSNTITLTVKAHENEKASSCGSSTK